MSDETVSVTVKPRSTRAGVTVEADGSVVVRVHAPAAEGAANRECVTTFAAAVGVPKSAVHIVRGERSRTKQLAIEGLSAAEVQARLRQSARGERSR